MAGRQPWPVSLGYAPAAPQQLARLCALPLLQFPTAPFLTKQLSPDNLLQVRAWTSVLLEASETFGAVSGPIRKTGRCAVILFTFQACQMM